MEIKGIAWAGIKAKNYEKDVEFFRDIMGFQVLQAKDDVTVFRLPNGDVFEVIGPTQAVELNDMDGLKVDFLVDNVEETVKELESKGIQIQGKVYSEPSQHWANFKGPNNCYYGITNMVGHPSHKFSKNILFYGPMGEYGWLSNWYNASIYLENKIWPSVEHYYQAKKFNGTEWEEICRRLPTAQEAYSFSRRPELIIDPSWDTKKEDVMRKAVWAKFSQNPELCEKLIATGIVEITEDSPIDNFWGIGADKKGLNKLGKIIMQVRGKLQS